MSMLDEMRALLGQEADSASPAKKKYKLRNLELAELSLVDQGANQHADVILAKRDTSETQGLVYSGTPEANRLMNNMRLLAKQDESASSRSNPSKPNRSPLSDDEFSRTKSPNDPAATIASLRHLLEQMTTLLKPETPTSDRVIDADIKDPTQVDQRRSNAYQSEGQSQADAQQAAREAQDEASWELAASVATRNNADILNAMMRIAGALNPNGVKSG